MAHSSASDDAAAPSELEFRTLVETRDHTPLDEVFETYWPAYRAWMTRAPAVDASTCRQRLGMHMPGLLDLYDSLVERFGGEDDVARFLSLWNPPPLVRGCTQLVFDDVDGPVLIRAYDHHPDLFDGVILRADWGGTRTLAIADCLWGALDGMNEHGLAIALAFGGRHAVGDGFGAQLVCRHVLQTCATVADARKALARTLVFMPYTFVVLDANGEFVTAYLAPDRDPTFHTRRASANHQGSIEWERYARFTRSSDRLARAESLLTTDPTRTRAAFLKPPIWRTNYAKGSGTLYVAEYAPSKKRLTLCWPGRTEPFTIDAIEEREFGVRLPSGASTHA
ncbi:MAG: hypothetical protein KDA30_13385 [Phycisphaerales bacterium]|nr:hypothetical protein [Phycisphaerales bacterium]